MSSAVKLTPEALRLIEGSAAATQQSGSSGAALPTGFRFPPGRATITVKEFARLLRYWRITAQAFNIFINPFQGFLTPFSIFFRGYATEATEGRLYSATAMAGHPVYSGRPMPILGLKRHG